MEEEIQQLININNKLNRKKINDILCLINDDNLKLKYIEYFKDDEIYLTNIICSIRSNELKLNYVRKTKNTFFIDYVANSIKDDIFLVKYYELFKDSFYALHIIKNINDDSLKEKYLSDFRIQKQIDIIKTFNDKLIIKYINNNEYNKYYLQLLDSLSKDNLIEYFYNCNNTILKLKYIKYISDNELKKELINTLDNKIYKEIFESNDVSYVKNNNYDNSSLCFSLKINTEHKLYNYLNVVNKILSNWTIYNKTDNTCVIESPVLNLNKIGIQEINYICEFLKNNDFTNEYISIYFKNINKDIIDNFIKIYINYEDIIYNITRDEKINKYKKFTYKNMNNNKCLLRVFDNNIVYKIKTNKYKSIVEAIIIFQKIFENSKNELFINKKKENNNELLDSLLNLLFNDKDQKKIYKDKFDNNNIKENSFIKLFKK